MNIPVNIISSISRKEVAEHRAEREREIEHLETQIVRARGRVKMELCSELLVFLGFIHNDPFTRKEWENR